MRKSFITFATLLCLSKVSAQTFQETANGIRFTANGVLTELQFYNAATVRVVKSPERHAFTKESLSVVAKPAKVKISSARDQNTVTLKTSELHVAVSLQTGAIAFADASGKALLTEESAPVFEEFNDAGVSAFAVCQPFALDKDEAIYGLGQMQDGKMSLRNIHKLMVQDNMEDFTNFLQSSKGYGLFWDNYSPTLFSDSVHRTFFRSEVGDCVDYYFMYGKNADGVIAHMRSLTGQTPMFPLWAYGYWQSRERYKSQEEIVGVVRKYRELGVPLDGIIQDWQYWGGNYLWNSMEFLSPDFNNPQKMVDDIHGLNAKIMISIWASFGPMTKQFAEMKEKNMLLDFETWPVSGVERWPPREDFPSFVRVYDAYNPAARDIYWQYLNKGLFSLGIDGWWMDSTDPDHHNKKPEDFDNRTFLGSFRKVRNAYPLATVGGVYDHQRAASSSKRVFILTRSAFAGQQRYGANTWTGDVTASWDVLRKQISAGLNFSLCAIPHWNSDIGGFFIGRDFPGKLANPEYRELYVRWMQFGAFCPMMRSHGADAPREIYQFGSKGEKYYDAIEKYINLRYRLLPYIYATAWEVSAHQSTFMRALAMDFGSDKNVSGIDNQYMFGKSLLVCPVTTPMYTATDSGEMPRATFGKVKSTRLYLPSGADWVDFWTGDKYSGGQHIAKETPLDILPVYVKTGSIIPFGHKVQYATEKSWDNLEIRIYTGANGKFTLYEDENDNYNYEKGEYSTITFRWNDKSKKLTIDARQGAYKGMLTSRKFSVVVVSPGNGAGDAPSTSYKTVNYDGKKQVVSL
ncbi:MAG: DUF5110 domain-containing protein [Prevotellaceae bacterium]|jgi:alpha-D-xyloside xylohydrolase|nr:DUF5110 domain-containing protein [Prevotellaceae bacterium]